MSDKEKLDVVNYQKFKKCLESLERDLKGSPKVLENLDISFEYIMASLFPNIFNNIKDAMTQEYIRGFNDGKDNNNSKIKPLIQKEGEFSLINSKEFIVLAINDLKNLIRVSVYDEDKESLTELVNELNNIIKYYNVLLGREI